MAYTTTAAVKSYLGISGSGDDTVIGTLVTAAQAAIDRYCRRTFEASGDTVRYFTVGVDSTNSRLFLDEDLCQITSVVTNADGASPITITASEYVTMPRNATPYHAIKILSSSGKIWDYTDDPEMGIEITGRWAYSVTAPDAVVQACIRWAGFMYRQRDAQTFDVTAIPEAGVITVPSGIPRDVELMLLPFVRVLYDD